MGTGTYLFIATVTSVLAFSHSALSAPAAMSSCSGIYQEGLHHARLEKVSQWLQATKPQILKSAAWDLMYGPDKMPEHGTAYRAVLDIALTGDLQTASILRFANAEMLSDILKMNDKDLETVFTGALQQGLVHGNNDSATDVREIQTEARIVLGRMLLPEKKDRLSASVPRLTKEQFAMQANVLGIKVRHYPTTYKIDAKPPAKVAKEGFLSEDLRPNLDNLSLAENMQKHRSHSRFIELNSHLGKINNLKRSDTAVDYSRTQELTDLIVEAGQFVDTRRNIPIKADSNSQISLSSPNFRTTYEYAVSSIDGVRLEKELDSNLSTPSNILTNAVDPQQVTLYRELTYAEFMVDGRLLTGIVYGLWKPMPK